MKKFIKKIVLYVSAYLIISNLLFLFVPYHFGNPWYSSKIKFLEKKEDSIGLNTFFFGSSRVYRQINPTIFDSICSVNSGYTSSAKIKSFNLGAPATFAPQTYYLYENFLESKLSEKAKYCFLEISDVQKIPDDQLGQERTNYFVNSKILSFASRSFFNDKRYNIPRKVYSTSIYFVSFLENLFHLGHLREGLMDKKYYDLAYVGIERNGFYPLESEYQETNDNGLKNVFSERKQKLIDNPSVLNKRKVNFLELEKKSNNNNCNNINLKKIKHLIEKSKEKDIHLFFILSPRLDSKEIFNLSKKIPKQHIINMGSPNVYPEFYSLENSFDIGHLNNKGADLYSKKIALEFFNSFKK